MKSQTGKSEIGEDIYCFLTLLVNYIKSIRKLLAIIMTKKQRDDGVAISGKTSKTSALTISQINADKLTLVSHIHNLILISGSIVHYVYH